METPQSQMPSPNQSGQAPSASGARDLYSAITAEDEIPVVAPTPKKHISPFMKMVIAFMRLTFWVDLTKRSNEPVFRLLSVVWKIFMTILYLSGIITFILCLTSFVHLPLKLETFFNNNNVKYDTLEIADYSLSQINIANLHDENNTYQIPQVQIHSTFGDFLKNKILAIDADGVKINIKSNSTDKSSIQWMLDLFSAFNGNITSKLDVNSLTINNAVLTLSGQKITIPIAFSLTGDYTQSAQTAILFNINEDFLKAQGTLSLSGSPEEQNLKLTITSGAITLPNHPEEELLGEINAVIQNNDIQTADIYLSLNYGHSLKEIQINLQKSTATGFDGTLSFNYTNTATEESAEIPLTAFTAQFKTLQINEKGQIFTTEPLELNIQKLEQPDVTIEGLETLLNGELICQPNEFKCSYTLKAPSDINLSSLIWRHKGTQIIFNKNTPFHLLVNNQPNFTLQLATPTFQSNLSLDNVETAGYINKEGDSFNMKAERIQLANVLAEKQSQTSLALDITEGQIQTPALSMQGISFRSSDIFSTTTPSQFQAQSVNLNSPLIKKNFSMQLVSLDKQSSIKLQVSDTNIICIAKGFFDLFQMSFNGNFLISPFSIQELPFELQELSDYIPKNLTNLSGKITLLGKKVNISDKGNISGALWLGLKNISFDTNETHIQNLNSVIALQSLVPLISVPNQTFAIENIEDVVNLSNITGTFQITNQIFRLFNLSGQLANQTLFASNTNISLDDPSAMIYLKTAKDFKINDLTPYLSLTNLTLQEGTGALALPIEISKKGLHLSELTFKVNDTTLSPQNNNDRDIFNLFDNTNTAYYIRGGKFTLTKGTNLGASLEGWLIPTRQKHSLETSQIILPYPLLKKGTVMSLPDEIYKKLNLLFTEGKTS